MYSFSVQQLAVRLFFSLVTLFSLLTATPALAAPIESASNVPDLQLQVPFGDTTEVNFDAGEDTVTFKGLALYIRSFYMWLIGAVATVAVLSLMYGGFLWVTTGGTPARAKQAKTVMTNALAGLALTLGSYTILAVINPSLVTFSLSNIGRIERVDLDTAPIARVPGSHAQTLSSTAAAARAEQNKVLYQKIANEKNVPWKLLAAIHYKEGGNNLNKSALNGFALCNSEDYSRCNHCNDGATIENDLRCAAQLLQHKSQLTYPRISSYPDRNRKFTLTKDTTDQETIANVAYRYNGVGYGPYTKSPYVVNHLPGYGELRISGCVKSTCCKLGPPRTGCWINTVDKNDGILAFMARLRD